MLGLNMAQVVLLAPKTGIGKSTIIQTATMLDEGITIITETSLSLGVLEYQTYDVLCQNVCNKVLGFDYLCFVRRTCADH